MITTVKMYTCFLNAMNIFPKIEFLKINSYLLAPPQIVLDVIFSGLFLKNIFVFVIRQFT